MKMMYYVAYGSNLNLKSFLERCSSARLLGITMINNYSLVFKGDTEGYSYLTLEEDMESKVPIAVFELSSFDVLRLDKYEGYPMLYSKKYLSINLDGKEINAMTYIMNLKFDYHLPSLDYINNCVRGYKYFGFDKEYLVKALLNTNQKRQKGR